jgi:hypothetical protein
MSKLEPYCPGRDEKQTATRNLKKEKVEMRGIAKASRGAPSRGPSAPSRGASSAPPSHTMTAISDR